MPDDILPPPPDGYSSAPPSGLPPPPEGFSASRPKAKDNRSGGQIYGESVSKASPYQPAAPKPAPYNPVQNGRPFSLGGGRGSEEQEQTETMQVGPLKKTFSRSGMTSTIPGKLKPGTDIETRIANMPLSPKKVALQSFLGAAKVGGFGEPPTPEKVAMMIAGPLLGAAGPVIGTATGEAMMWPQIQEAVEKRDIPSLLTALTIGGIPGVAHGTAKGIETVGRALKKPAAPQPAEILNNFQQTPYEVSDVPALTRLRLPGTTGPQTKLLPPAPDNAFVVDPQGNAQRANIGNLQNPDVLGRPNAIEKPPAPVNPYRKPSSMPAPATTAVPVEGQAPPRTQGEAALGNTHPTPRETLDVHPLTGEDLKTKAQMQDAADSMNAMFPGSNAAVETIGRRNTLTIDSGWEKKGAAGQKPSVPQPSIAPAAPPSAPTPKATAEAPQTAGETPPGKEPEYDTLEDVERKRAGNIREKIQKRLNEELPYAAMPKEHQDIINAENEGGFETAERVNKINRAAIILGRSGSTWADKIKARKIMNEMTGIDPSINSPRFGRMKGESEGSFAHRIRRDFSDNEWGLFTERINNLIDQAKSGGKPPEEPPSAPPPEGGGNIPVQPTAPTVKGPTNASTQQVSAKVGEQSVRQEGTRPGGSEGVGPGQQGPETARTGQAQVPQGVQELNPQQIAFDPDRFQYKTLAGDKGISGELKSVKKWDVNRGGILLTWVDTATGKRFVVNGHNRLELAQRAGAPSVVTRDLAVGTPQEARQIGAMTNIAEGRGDAVDAAKLFRDSGMTAADLENEGVSLRGKVAADGLALSRLPEGLWRMVYKRELPIDKGAAIGGSGFSQSQQMALWQLIQKSEKGVRSLTPGQIEQLANVVRGSGETTGHGAGMFDDMEFTKSHAVEKATLADWVTKELGKDKRIFGPLADQQRKIEAEKFGNVLKTDENKRIADAAERTKEIFGRLAFTKGHAVADALNDAAAKLAAGGNPDAIKALFKERVRQAVSEVVSGRKEGSPAGIQEGTAGGSNTGATAGTADLFGETPETKSAGLTIKKSNPRRGSFDASIAEDVARAVQHGAELIGKKIVTFAKWSGEMVKEFGDTIRPHLVKLWDQSHDAFKAGATQKKDEPIPPDIQSRIERLNAQTGKPEQKPTAGENIGNAIKGAWMAPSAWQTIATPFHAVLRHGLPLTLNHPGMAAESIGQTWKAFASKEGFAQVREFIDNLPTKQMADHYGVADTGQHIADPTRGEEEMIGNAFLQKIPGGGSIVGGLKNAMNANHRGFVTYLDLMAQKGFAKKAAQLEQWGITPAKDEAAYKGLAGLINNERGRGSLGPLENQAALAAAVMYAPRLQVSRIALMNPVYYAKMEPGVRRIAITDAAKGIGVAVSAIMAAKAAGAEVPTDPRDSNFLKMKFGNRWVDPLGGFRSYIPLAVQSVTGQKIVGGQLKNNVGFGESRGTVAAKLTMQEIRKKFSPSMGMAYNLSPLSKDKDSINRNAVGDVSTPVSEAENVGTPFFGRDLLDYFKHNDIGSTIAGEIASQLGASSYEPSVRAPSFKSKGLGGANMKSLLKSGG